MHLPVSLFVGLRYSRAGKGGKFIGFISAFSMAGIALGVMALILVMSVMDGFENLLKQRMLGAVPQVVISSQSDKNLSVTQIESISSELELSEHILQVLPLIQNQAILQIPGELKGVMAQGVTDIDSVPIGVKNFITQGSWQTLLDSRYGMVIGRFLAMEYGLAVGDKVRLMVSGASHFTPLGRMPAQRNFTIVGIFETESEIDQQIVLTRGQDLNRLMKKKKDNLEGVRLVLQDPFDALSISEQLRSHPQLQGIQVESWRKTHGKLFEAVKMEKTMMWVMLSLIIAVAAFNIVSALVMMVTRKQSEVAILKTLGMKSGVIERIFMFQGAYNGLFGALIGAVIGVLLTLNLNGILSTAGVNLLGVPGVGLPVAFSWFKVIYVVFFAFLLALLASVYPAKKAANLLPADVLRYE